MKLIEIYKIIKESTTTRLKWSQLTDDTKTDIVDQLFSHVRWIEDNFSRSGFTYELDETTDEPIFIIDKMNVDDLFTQMSKTHSQYSGQVTFLVNALKQGKDLDPIMVKNGNFFDGGHRLAAYKQAGVEKIPTIEIGFLLDLDWEGWWNGDVSIN